MNDREFSTHGKNFKLCKINAFKQFHIARRVGPILSELLPVLKEAHKFQTITSVEKLPEEEKFEMISRVASPFMSGISKLSDADAEMVLLGLLSSVEMQQPAGNWAKVATETMMMIQDLELPVMLNLAGRAFFYNLSGFFAALPQ